MKRVFITGVTGYIGSNLARALLPKYEVFALVRSPLNTTNIDDIASSLHLYTYDGSYASIEVALRDIRPNIVYHLATHYTGTHDSDATPKMISANIDLGVFLLEAMCQTNCHSLIYTTTVMEHYAKESYRPLNLYAATKRALSDILTYYTDTGYLNAVTLVLSDTYGPNDNRPKILNLIKKALEERRPIELSDGSQDYDLVHIDDVINALVLAGRLVQTGECGRFQVCAEQPLTLRETVERMIPSYDNRALLLWGSRPVSGRIQKKAVRLFPTLPEWKPKVTLENGSRLFFGYQGL